MKRFGSKVGHKTLKSSNHKYSPVANIDLRRTPLTSIPKSFPTVWLHTLSINESATDLKAQISLATSSCLSSTNLASRGHTGAAAKSSTYAHSAGRGNMVDQSTARARTLQSQEGKVATPGSPNRRKSSPGSFRPPKGYKNAYQSFPRLLCPTQRSTCFNSKLIRTILYRRKS